jgi:LysM repeat protein
MNKSMNRLRSTLGSIGLAVLAILIVLGSLSQSLVEGSIQEAESSPTLAPTSIFETTLLPNLLSTATFTTRLTSTPSPEPTVTRVATQTEALCQKPGGWVAYTVQPGDSVYQLSRKVGISSAEIITANCLENTTLQPDQVLFLPRSPIPEEN